MQYGPSYGPSFRAGLAFADPSHPMLFYPVQILGGDVAGVVVEADDGGNVRRPCSARTLITVLCTYTLLPCTHSRWPGPLQCWLYCRRVIAAITAFDTTLHLAR